MKPQDFRYRQFLPTIILQCMRWYLRYPLSYRNLEEMMAERGIKVAHSIPSVPFIIKALTWPSP